MRASPASGSSSRPACITTGTGTTILGRYAQADPLGFVDEPSLYGYAKGESITACRSAGLSSDDGKIIPIPIPKPPAPIAGPDSAWQKWAKDKLKKCSKWIRKPSCGWLEAKRDQYLDGYRKADAVTQKYLSAKQKPVINEEIADHNQQSPHNKVAYL